MDPKRWAEVCSIAALLMLDSDGEVPALAAIGQAARMVNVKPGANENRA